MPETTKVSPGDPLAIPAGTWNAVLDLLNTRRIRTGGARGADFLPDAITPQTVVYVQNSTGAALAIGGAIRIGDAVTAVSATAPTFNAVPVFDGLAVEATTDAVAVALEPIADGAIGRAVIQGVAIATVEVGDVAHRYASPTAGEAYLTSGTSGPVRLMSVPGGTGSQTVAALLTGGATADAGEGFTAVAARFVTASPTVTITTAAPTQLVNCGDTVSVLDGGFDTGGFFVGDLFTVPSNGYYLCGMQGELYSPSTALGAYPVMITFQQWAPVSYGPILMIEYVLTDGLDRATFNCSSLHYLNAGERYRPYITCNDTSLHPFDVEVSQFRTWMVKLDAVGAGSGGGGSTPDGVGSYAGYSRFGSV